MAKVESSVTIAEFARQVGKSPQWIRKLILKGAIPRNPDGKIPLDEGFKAWEECAKRSEAVKAIQKRQSLPDDDGELASSVNSARNITEAFNKARLAKETYLAKLKEIEYRLKKGELIEAEEVKADAQAVASALRERLASIPVRISGLCEGRPAREIEEIIEDAINDALTQFQKTKFVESDE